LEKGENKTMQDTEKTNRATWDDKFQQVLWQLQDYQEAKDNPQPAVVNIEVEELFVNTQFSCKLAPNFAIQVQAAI
jgi:hypothetical protein